jgi:Bacterial mobilisation protein (MobC)
VRNFAFYFAAWEILAELPSLASHGAPKMARLRKQDKGERCTEHVGFYVTPTAKVELDRRVASSSLQLSEWCRRALLSDALASAPACDYEAIRQLVVAMNRVGNNVNQMTALANKRGHLPTQRALSAVLDQIIAAVRKVRDL